MFIDKLEDHDDNPKTKMQRDNTLDLGEDVLCQEDVGSDDTASCEFTVTHPTFTGGPNYISAVDGRDNKASEYAEFTLEESIQASPAGGSPGEIMLIQVVDFPGNQGVTRVQLGGLNYCGSSANPYGDIRACPAASTDATGTTNFPVTVPNWARSGTQQLKVYIGGKNASTNVDIGGPQINVTPGTVLANQRISLVGTGFSSNAIIGDDNGGISMISIGGKTISRSKINGGDDVEVDSGGNWSAFRGPAPGGSHDRRWRTAPSGSPTPVVGAAALW